VLATSLNAHGPRSGFPTVLQMQAAAQYSKGHECAAGLRGNLPPGRRRC
jgi:hypothetical protein